MGCAGDFGLQDQLAADTANELERQGVCVIREAVPKLTDEAASEHRSVPWERTDTNHGDADGRFRYMGLVLRLLEWQMAARLWAEAPKHVQSKERRCLHILTI